MSRSSLFLALLLGTVGAAGQDARYVPTASEKPACEEAEWFPRPDFTTPDESDPHLLARLMRYAELAGTHRVSGLASYYSAFFDGRKTASGEIFRNARHSAAHLTLPLGTWIEVRSRATGKSLRLKVNDRGPYARKFALDLSKAAARYLGVDVARDRHVEMRIIALPGEKPLPERLDPALMARAEILVRNASVVAKGSGEAAALITGE